MSDVVDISVGSADRRVQSQVHLRVGTAAADDVSFEAFYLEHAAPIGRALELTLQHAALAEDALNEAMVRALARWSTVQHFANPAGWVYSTAMNWARSFLRRRRRERDRPLHQRPEIVGSAFEPGLARALDRLSVDHRAVVVCRYQLDWTTAETAAALGIAEGTVKSRLSRALDQIRADLGVTQGSET